MMKKSKTGITKMNGHPLYGLHGLFTDKHEIIITDAELIKNYPRKKVKVDIESIVRWINKNQKELEKIAGRSCI